MKRFLFFVIILFSAASSFAQNTNKVWCFAKNKGLDFNVNPPTQITSRITTMEGCASISDENGQLLFYVSHDSIYNRNFQPMVNGYNILVAPGEPGVNPGSCSQPNVIVKKPYSDHIYYVFALEGFSDQLLRGRLFYSVVDMNLNGGLGGVVPGQKRILVDSAFQEKMTVTSACGSVWVVLRCRDTPAFKSFRVSAAGVNSTPVISPVPITVGYPSGDNLGVMKFSHDGTKLANANFFHSGQSALELCDFNSVTGVVSNYRALSNNLLDPYGVCFSPDNTKLYVSAREHLVQYDVTQPTTAAIISSASVLKPDQMLRGDVQMGADGKLYYVHRYHVGVIHNPNASGAACNAQDSVYFFSGIPFNSFYGLPNDIGNIADTSVLPVQEVKNCGTAVLSSSNSTGPWMWSTGAQTQSITVTDTGLFAVTAFSNCQTELFHVVRDTARAPQIVMRDTALCNFDQTTLTVTAQVYNADATAQYQWGPPSQIISQSGPQAVISPVSPTQVIYLKVTNREQGPWCVASDSASMRITYKSIDVDVADATICLDKAPSVQVSVPLASGNSATWSNGGSGALADYFEEGRQWVKVSNGDCSVTDSFWIEKTYCDCQVIVPNAFSPNGDGLNDFFMPKTQTTKCWSFNFFSFEIYNRWGQKIFATRDPSSKGWDGTYANGQKADAGVYFYKVHFQPGMLAKKTMTKGEVTLIR